MNDSTQPISYNIWLSQHNLLTKFPIFKKSQRNISLSNEAYEGLEQLAEIFTSGTEDGKHSISKMLEALGLNQLTINKPVELELNNTTTIECYEAGIEDAQ